MISIDFSWPYSFVNVCEALGFERMADRVFPDGFVLLGYEKRLDA